MNSRRIFIKNISTAAGSIVLASSVLNIYGCGEKDENNQNLDKNVRDRGSKKLGVALVGLGNYSEKQLGPALKETKLCKLTGIVTGTPGKIDTWKKNYDIPDKNVYNYSNFESIIDNKDIDIVYVVLPNGLHAEYSIKAAKAGKHVICEKPMAVSVEQCEAMIEACKNANKLLSIGYRLHFEPFNMEMMRLGSEKPYGEITKLSTSNGFQMTHKPWRVNKELAGGGPLMDMGVYCIQGAIYTIGKNPISVLAEEGKKTELDRFAEVEQSIKWTMEFPGGVFAECFTSYNEDVSFLRADAEKGWFELQKPYAYTGKSGSTSAGAMNFPDVYEQALQMDDFANCVLNNKTSIVPGEMGLRDVKIVMAIYEAAKTGKKVMLNL